MIDGVPANAVGDGEYNFADFPMEDIERIELLRGPQSGLYGANAHSGVLTIVTRSGRGLTRPEFSARFEGGTQGSAEGAMSARGSAGPFYGARHHELRDDQRLQHRAQRVAGRRRERRRAAFRRHRQGRHRLHAQLQRRGLRAPRPAARPTSIRRTRTSSTPAWWRTRRGYFTAVQRNARARRGHAQAVRRPLDPVGEVDHRRGRNLGVDREPSG